MADSSSNTGATTMAELLAKSQSSVVSLKRGDTVKGQITRLSKNEIYVNIQAKGEAFVLEKDFRLQRILLNTLNVGDEVEVSVISPESDNGYPVVSLRRYLEEITWKKIEVYKKSQEKIDAMVTDVTRGGYLLATNDGITGFLPNSHTLASQLSVGKPTQVVLADANREDHKVLFTQKITMPVEEFEKVTAALKKGTKVQGRVASVAPFGYFITLTPGKDEDKTVDGLLHVSELSWDRTDDPMNLYKVGDELETVVIGIDREARRIDLSIKQLTADPFDELKEKFPVDKKVSGRVLRLEEGNVILDLGEEVEGMIKKEKVPPNTSYEVGQTVNATVSALDSRRRRIELVPVLLEKPLMYR